MLYDAFFVESQIHAGRLAQQDVTRMIAGGQFRSIQLELTAAETLQPVRRLRFSEETMRAIVEHYQPKFRASGFAILVPRNEP
jgi:hypothetical protein